jgi:hypothetical protein
LAWGFGLARRLWVERGFALLSAIGRFVGCSHLRLRGMHGWMYRWRDGWREGIVADYNSTAKRSLKSLDPQTHTYSLSLSLSHTHTPSLPPPHLSPTHQSCAPPSSNSISHHKDSLLIIQSPSKHIQPNPLRSAIRSTYAAIPPPHPSTSRMKPPANLPSRPQQRIRRCQTRKIARLCPCTAHDVFMRSFIHSSVDGSFSGVVGGRRKG